MSTTTISVIHLIHNWQDLLGAILGASAPFALWWFAEKYQQYRKKKEDLYYLIRVVNDQICNLVDIKDSINSFIETKLSPLIENQRPETDEQYSVDMAFFPLFASHSISDDIRTKPTGSGYIDAKIARAFQISKDLPFVVDDLRQQFKETLLFNREISFNKLNSPSIQRANYITHLKTYRKVLKAEMLDHNIPLFLKVLTETLMPVIELHKIGVLRWRFRFDSRYRCYLSKEKFMSDKMTTIERIDKYFEPIVAKQIEVFNTLPKSSKA